MKVLHVCYADSEEGGAIGAYRLHTAMRSQGIDSRFLAIRKRRDDDTVFTPSFLRRILIRFWNVLSFRIIRLQKTSDAHRRSLNLFPTGIHRLINRHKPDVVQCHWINRNLISVRELTRIRAPVVLKLPDMWAFCGTEHYLPPGATKRYRDGYTRINRQEGDSGLDLDRIVWNYKKRVWRDTDFTVVTPSKWLGECARESILFGGYRIENIANPIDLEVYRPWRDRSEARLAMNLPPDKHLVLFGSVGADSDPRKGFRHLEKALAMLQAEQSEIGEFEFLIFGTRERKTEVLDGIVTHRLGTILHDRELAMMYSAADVMVLPTEADNLPNTVQEATACGTPSVGFNVGGLPDMILHKETGYLAQPFDAADLASGIRWTIANKGESMTQRVRQHAAHLFDPVRRVNDYMEIYQELVRARPSPNRS